MIVYYVHHHGSGHAHRAVAVAARCRTPVVGVGSGPAPSGWPGAWHRLPPDTGGDTGPGTADVTAGGTLHWVPRHHEGLRERTGIVSELLRSGPARLLVADVSVEMTLLARLHGVPVAVMAQPGDRLDRPHRTAYDLADVLLAPWPRRPEHGWPAEWPAKTRYLGGLSRYDDRPAGPAVPGARRVLVLSGSGGDGIDAAAVRAAAAGTPDWTWTVAGPSTGPGLADPPGLRRAGWSADVWSLLRDADVVVGHAGQNVVAEIAAARRPAVIIPQPRPHDEQLATAAALDRAGLATVPARWPAPREWPAVLAGAVARGGERWREWSDGGAADRAAGVLDALAAMPVAGGAGR
ncbi:glycosyltransferase [Pseudonocardia sp. HH130630-07]|uniref:glycosyltransferase n=1 Tax=Pseudonocardia sp. HH130630-07 TaxID=1690815 RepID=UPI00081505B2|nr:glycosyltransferase [Pseudonocardia sp. HH130630-07]ANY08887.1 hypothetical protein AFB00_24445 [Pseudonocardia sp. HH130630-07]